MIEMPDISFYAVKRAFERILHKEIDDKRWKTLLQFIGFGLVGVSNTIISYAIYALLVRFSVHYIAASIIGFVVSVINAFFWNNKYVFKLPEEKKRYYLLSFFKTFLAYSVTGLLIANILLYLWIHVLGISKYFAPVLNLVITIPLNFVLNKFWAFKTE